MPGAGDCLEGVAGAVGAVTQNIDDLAVAELADRGVGAQQPDPGRPIGRVRPRYPRTTSYVVLRTT